MPIEKWSDDIWVVELSGDPGFTDDLVAILDEMESGANVDVVLNFSGVGYMNSSNIAKLLKLRKLVSTTNQSRLKLCGINPHVWGVFLVTGLDKIFDLVDDVPSGLAALQMGE